MVMETNEDKSALELLHTGRQARRGFPLVFLSGDL